jgi:(4S)-4-hydroxy-5-phosphonooxypentane-2,3-dione isomerase
LTAVSIFHTAHLRVREDIVERFRDRLLSHARISLDAEPGCHGFNIHQETNDPTLFLLIEIYADQAAFDAHRNSPHYLQFREDVKDWVVDRKWWYWRHLGPNGA